MTKAVEIFIPSANNSQIHIHVIGRTLLTMYDIDGVTIQKYSGNVEMHLYKNRAVDIYKFKYTEDTRNDMYG